MGKSLKNAYADAFASRKKLIMPWDEVGGEKKIIYKEKKLILPDGSEYIKTEKPKPKIETPYFDSPKKKIEKIRK